MKKFCILFSAVFSGLFFAVPSFAAENAAGQAGGGAQAVQTVSQSVQPSQSAAPVQVNVNVNTSAHAEGNTQTAEISNAQNQTQSQYAAPANAAAVTSSAKQPGATGALYGDYANSPYQSNLQTEMLRHTVWGSLVPRKKLYRDPALGKYPPRYSAAKPKQSKPAVNSAKAVQGQPQNLHMQGTINGTVNGTFAGTVTGTVSGSVTGTVQDKDSAAVPNTAKETEKASFYEPLAKQGGADSVRSSTVQPSSVQNQPQNSQNSEVRKKVEDIQDALLIPKV